MKNYIEFCNEQAEKLFQIIDTHEGLLKWRKTWNVQGSLSLPRSVNGYYQGVNLWNLLHTQINRGLVSDTWLTFNQVKQQGEHVLKGARFVSVTHHRVTDITNLIHKISLRIARYLERAGFIERDAENTSKDG